MVQAREATPAEANIGSAPASAEVDSQITDSVTQTNVHTLSLGPAVAAVSSYLGLSQSQSILFTNAVNQQQQYSLVGLALTAQEVRRMLEIDDSGGAT